MAHFWKCPKFDLKNLNYKDFGLFLLDIDISRAVFTHLISFCSQSNKNPTPLICVDDVKTLFFPNQKFLPIPPLTAHCAQWPILGGEGGNTLDAQYAIKVSVKKRHFHPVPDV